MQWEAQKVHWCNRCYIKDGIFRLAACIESTPTGALKTRLAGCHKHPLKGEYHLLVYPDHVNTTPPSLVELTSV